MRLHPAMRRRPPSLTERLLGRRGLRRLRRRAGLAAVGTGLMLLRPRRGWAAGAAVTVLAGAGAVIAGAGLYAVIR